MVVALSNQFKVRFYGSHDLKHWVKLSDFGPAGAERGSWECPMLDKIHVLGHPSQTKWVLEISCQIGKYRSGQYFIGNFDGKSFIPEPNFRKGVHRVDYGNDFYAAISWSNIPPEDGRTIWLAGMVTGPTKPFRGMMTFPRSIHVKQGKNGYYITQKPVKELQELRGKHYHFK